MQQIFHFEWMRCIFSAYNYVEVRANIEPFAIDFAVSMPGSFRGGQTQGKKATRRHLTGSGGSAARHMVSM